MDWEKARAEYVTGRETYGQIAERYGVSKSIVGRMAKAGAWKKQRDAYRRSVADKAIMKASDRGAEQLSRLMDTADRVCGVLDQITEDPKQFFRWRSEAKAEGKPEEDIILRKADTKALKNATAALNEMVRVVRNLYGIGTREEERKARLEERKVKLMERREGAMEQEGGGVTIMMPEILAQEPEDAPEVGL